MPKTTKSKEVRFYVSEEFQRKLKAFADRRGESISDVCRRIMEEAIDQESAEDGLDTVLLAVRKAMRDVLKPVEERMAKISAKAAIASSTSMYMDTEVLQSLGKDAKTIYEKSRKKAVAYLRQGAEEVSPEE